MYFICLDTSEAKDELWYVIWHNLLRNPSKTGTRKAHIGRWSRRQRLKVGPVHLKEFSVPSGIHPFLYRYEGTAPKCWNPSESWGHELTCLCGSMFTPYKRLQSWVFPTKEHAPHCLECWMLQEGGRSGFKTSFLPSHSSSSCLFTQDYKSLKATVLQLTFCPVLLGRSWLLQAIYLPTYAKISLGFSETQNDLRNQRGKEPIFNITFPFHAMKTWKRY